MTRSERTPWITLLLILLNLGAAFAVVISPTFPDLSLVATHPGFSTFVGSMFVHANVVHLLGNMIFLAAIGPWVEQSVGSMRYLLVYLGAGLVGNLVHVIFARLIGSDVPLLGASGAIAGCAAYAGIRYMRTKVPLFPGVQVPVGAVIAIWLVLQVVGAFIKLGETGGGTAYWSHLGGALFGILGAVIFRADLQVHFRDGQKAMERLGDRTASAALTAARQHLAGFPNDARAREEEADALGDLGNTDEEIVSWLKILDIGSDAQRAKSVLRLAELDSLGILESHKLLSLADRLKGIDPRASQTLLDFALSTGTAKTKADALLGIAILWRETDPVKSQLAIERLSTEFPMEDAVAIARTRGLLR